MKKLPFLGLAVLAGVLAVGCADPHATEVYVNGRIWTANPDEPWAEAMAVRGEYIIYMGSAEAAEGIRGDATQIVDLDGAFVMPGFIDNHTHFLQGGFNLASVQLRDAATPEAFIRRMAAYAETLPEGQWILGGDWDHEAWGGELPDRAWIDSVTARNPVFVQRLDGHMGLANSLALDMAGVDSSAVNPVGGTIVRRGAVSGAADGAGVPTGILKDDAMNLIWNVVPPPSLDERLQMLRRAQEHAISLGVTQIHDVGSYGGWEDLEAFRAAERRRWLKLRIYSHVPLSSWRDMEDFVEEHDWGSRRVWWGGLKGMVDGSLGSTTALFHEPYLDEPDTRGLVVTDTVAMRSDILGAYGAGLHLSVHAIGDKANDWLLDVFAQARAVTAGSMRQVLRIEHAQHLTPEAIGRFNDLGVVPSMQPYHAIDDGRWAASRIGDRIRTTYAFRSLLDAGAGLTFGSDWTVAPLNPLLGVYAAATRRTLDGANPDGWVPEEKISVEEALVAYTRAAAAAGRSSAFSGVLEAGRLADFVVLSANLLEIDPVDIPDVRVVRTVIGGESVYEWGGEH